MHAPKTLLDYHGNWAARGSCAAGMSGAERVIALSQESGMREGG